jgi:hypothetical protein
VARYAESTGFEQDYDRPFAFHYRDFVIKALNSDMPYDQFVKWQLAGDEYEPQNPLALAATGFLGAGVFPSQITANEVESSPLRRDGRHAQHHGGRDARPHAELRTLPRSQIRSAAHPRLLRDAQHLHDDDAHERGRASRWQGDLRGDDDGQKKNTPEVAGATRMMICGEGYDPIVMHTQGGPFLTKRMC